MIFDMYDAGGRVVFRTFGTPEVPGLVQVSDIARGVKLPMPLCFRFWTVSDGVVSFCTRKPKVWDILWFILDSMWVKAIWHNFDTINALFTLLDIDGNSFDKGLTLPSFFDSSVGWFCNVTCDLDEVPRGISVLTGKNEHTRLDCWGCR